MRPRCACVGRRPAGGRCVASAERKQGPHPREQFHCGNWPPQICDCSRTWSLVTAQEHLAAFFMHKRRHGGPIQGQPPALRSWKQIASQPNCLCLGIFSSRFSKHHAQPHNSSTSWRIVSKRRKLRRPSESLMSALITLPWWHPRMASSSGGRQVSLCAI